MGKRIAVVAGSLLAVIAGLAAAFLISMRLKVSPVQNTVRKMNRRLLNPKAMETAGEVDSGTSIVRHVGRASGKTYETPVGAVKVSDGFVIALPYGTSPDWLKNVRAAGQAVIVHDGETWNVDKPELVSADIGNAYFDPNTQRVHRLFGVNDFLMLDCRKTAA